MAQPPRRAIPPSKRMCPATAAARAPHAVPTASPTGGEPLPKSTSTTRPPPPTLGALRTTYRVTPASTRT
jgi:hypothetical protein